MRMYEYLMCLRKSAAVEIVLKTVIFQCDLVFWRLNYLILSVNKINSSIQKTLYPLINRKT